MKLCIFFVAVFLVSSSRAFLSLTVTDEQKRMIFYNYLTDTCNCNDRLSICPFLTARCNTDSTVNSLCLVSCGRCTVCPVPVQPTLYPTLQPCQFNCSNIWPAAICEFYNSRRLCPSIRGYCRVTCLECTPCALPPVSLPPCQPDCADNLPARDCEFWRTRGFCDEVTLYPSVRFNCQSTCGICRQCSS